MNDPAESEVEPGRLREADEVRESMDDAAAALNADLDRRDAARPHRSDAVAVGVPDNGRFFASDLFSTDAFDCTDNATTTLSCTATAAGSPILASRNIALARCSHLPFDMQGGAIEGIVEVAGSMHGGRSGWGRTLESRRSATAGSTTAW